jgi:hypothetical protein
MYINAVADSVMLYLQHNFYNIIFKIKHKLYIASWSAPPQRKILGAHVECKMPYTSVCKGEQLDPSGNTWLLFKDGRRLDKNGDYTEK